MGYSGSSLAEARQLYETLEKSVELTRKLEQQTQRTSPKLSQAISLAYGLLSIFKRMGLPDDVEAGISRVMRLISVLNMLRTSMIALEAASGPIGWALAAIGAVGTVLAFQEELEMQRRSWQP